MFRSIFLLLACCLAYFKGTLWGQNTLFEKITIENGLSQGMVHDIIQTRSGFLWAGLEAGLNRYDGYNFKVFTHNDKQPFSIAENRATAFLEDSRGWLWLGLFSKGVDVYDSRTGFFHHFSLDFEDANNRSEQVRRIVETPDGAIWVLLLNGKGLYRIAIPEAWKNGLPAEPNLQRLATLAKVALPQFPQPQTPIWSLSGNMFAQDGGSLSVVVSKGQFQVDTKTMAVRWINEGLLPDSIVHAEQGDPAYGGDLWAVNNIGLWRVRQGQTVFFKTPLEHLGRRFFCRGKEGHVWFVFHQKMWDLAPGEDFDPERPDLVFDAPVSCCNYDQTNNFWVGTMGFGLRKINALQGFFHAGFTNTPVSGLWAHKGRYFVKRFFDILDFDPKTGKLSGKLAFNDVQMWQISLAFEPPGAVWLLCRGAKGMLRRYPLSSARADRVHTFEAPVAYETPLLRTPDGMLWIASKNDLLIRFDPVSAHFDYFNYEHLFQKKNEIKRVLALAQDANGTIWIGTERGLVKGMPTGQGMVFQVIKADPDNPKALNHNIIAGILPDPSAPGERLWLATKGGGINIFDIHTGQCRHITTANGLLNDVVYGILPGNRKGEFWCSTNRGLARIALLPESPNGELQYKINTFTAKVGLQGNEFNTQAYSKSSEGELLFGGPDGLNHFFPDDIKPDDPTPPRVRIVGLEINHKKVDFEGPGGLLPMPLENLRELHLSHEQDNVSFEFGALDFTDPSKNCYRYRLVGLEKNWVELGNYHFAHFSHLAPGRYELRVQANNGESDWGEAQPLIVVVHPPWWRSNLAYFCYFVLLAWAGWRAYQFQIGRVKEREQLAFEQRETERVKALEQLKTNFFSNVTHEFRTPLSLILEPARQLLKNPKDPLLMDKIRLIEKHGRQLQRLVNQLLDMAKLEAGQMPLELRRGDFGTMARDVFEAFLPLAEQRGIKLALRQPQRELGEMDFDPGKMELVLNNLLSNALKFTPAGGKVELYIAVEERPTTPPLLQVSVSDTGMGIAPEHLDKIFDRFYQVDASSTRAREGTGIGLALSKELARRMGGDLTVRSTLGEGAVFTLSVPMVKSADPMPWTPLTVEGPTPDTPYIRPTPDPQAPVALLIEDNADLRAFIAHSLSGGGQVIEASNGEEGEQKALDLLPDIIVCDVMMPKKDGFAVVDALKNNELTAHIPIVLLTAKADIESKLKGLRRGADDYLGKPFSTEELLARMENLVALRRRLRALLAQQPLVTLGLAPEAAPASDGAAALSDPDRDFLRRFNLLIEQYMDDEEITVEDFANKLFVSRMQLHRKLTALTGHNATGYVRNYRLERAMQLLENKEGNVYQVAFRVGFNNEKYFSTVFREKFGVSPSQV